MIFHGLKSGLELFIAYADLKDDKIQQLFIAYTENNEPEIIRLIENGVDVNYKTTDGYSPLLFEIKQRNCNKNIVEFLLKSGADINIIDNNNGYNSLIYACDRDDIELVELLVNYGIDINFQNSKNGNTALMEACINSRYDIAHFLLEKGANPNIQNNSGYTALMFSLDDFDYVIELDINFIKFLIKSGANINIQDHNGNTAVMQFISNYVDYHAYSDDEYYTKEIYEILKYLLSCDYNFGIINNDKNNLLMCANSDINFMKIILDYLDQH